jgi:hypothetical protein
MITNGVIHWTRVPHVLRGRGSRSAAIATSTPHGNPTTPR